MPEPTIGLDIDLSAAFESTLGVLRKVDRGDLDKPTPCKSWDVRTLINHFVGSARWAASAISGDESLARGEDDYTAGDFVAAYEQSMRLALREFAVEGALQKMVKVSFGEFPGVIIRGLFTAADQFTHGWDLARAIGLSTDLAPDLAVSLLGLVQATVGENWRGPDTEALFGPVRQAPDGATAADRLAAYLGRVV